MTLAFVPYPYGVLHALLQPGAGIFDLDSEPVKVLLCTSAYVPSDAHESLDDVTGELAAGGGYATGGLTLGGVSVTVTDTTVAVDADDAIWPGATFGGVRYEVLYLDNGQGADCPLIGYVDNETDRAAVNQDFVVRWADQGIYRFVRV